MWRKKDLPHQVIQKLHYWAHEITNGKKSREEISQRMAEVIEELAKEQYNEFIATDRHLFFDAMREEWEKEKNRLFNNEKHGLEVDRKKINDKIESLAKFEKQLMESDPKFIAAQRACELASKYAGIEEPGEEVEYPNGPGFYERIVGTGKFRRVKESKYSSSEEYTKQQLVRTIGVIWAAAFGMKAIGGNAGEENDKK